MSNNDSHNGLGSSWQNADDANSTHEAPTQQQSVHDAQQQSQYGQQYGSNAPQNASTSSGDATAQNSYGQGQQSPQYGQGQQYSSSPQGQGSYGQPYTSAPQGQPYGQHDQGVYGTQQYGQNQQYSSSPQGQYGQGDTNAQPYGQNQQYGQPQQFGQGQFAQQGQYGQPYGAMAPQGGQPFASWGKRVGAYVIDSLLTLPFGIGSWLAMPQLYVYQNPDGTTAYTEWKGGSMPVVFLMSLLSLAIVVWNQGYRQGKTGQSIGKKVIGTKLVSEQTGQPIGFGMAVVRQLAHIVDAIPCYIGFLWPLWDAKKQTLADKMLHTVVVDEPKGH